MPPDPHSSHLPPLPPSPPTPPAITLPPSSLPPSPPPSPTSTSHSATGTLSSSPSPRLSVPPTASSILPSPPPSAGTAPSTAVVRRPFRDDTAALPAHLAALCRSHHITIACLLGSSLSGDDLYLVCEYILGATLADCLRNPRNP